jgi:multidrug transporter EmrE-like cation transporter
VADIASQTVKEWSTMAGIVIQGEPASPARVGALLLILAGVIGLRVLEAT